MNIEKMQSEAKISFYGWPWKHRQQALGETAETAADYHGHIVSMVRVNNDLPIWTVCAQFKTQENQTEYVTAITNIWRDKLYSVSVIWTHT